MNFGLFLCGYLIVCVALDQYYSRLYQWQNNCLLQRFLTSLGQPIMEIIGNGMTAHFWHFERFAFDKTKIDSKYILNVGNKPFSVRVFDRNKLLAILTSIWVDINPFQDCLIIKPKNYDGQWSLVFPKHYDNNIFEQEKCLHTGQVKVVIDGQGMLLARDSNGNWLELEITNSCKAYQYRNVLFI